MKFKCGHYIDMSEQREILCAATCDSERRRSQATIITNNCLAKFRGWDGHDEKRARVIESIRNERLYFSTALGYNDPYDTLMYIDKAGLLEFIEQTLAVQMSQMVLQLEKLPSCTLQEAKPITPTFLRADTEYPLAADYIKRAKYQSSFLRGTRKYEFGANSWDAVTFWMSAHPFEMIFIGGFICDAVKFLIGKVSRLLKRKPVVKSKTRPMVLMVGRFYKKFEQLTHIKKEDCQIVSLKRIRPGVFSVLVRTSTDEKFKVISRTSGAIETLKPIDKALFDSESTYVL